jgi:hypothetical protein
MDKRQITIFCIYSPLDVPQIEEMSQVLREEENVVFERYFDAPSGAEIDYEKIIERADLVLALASDRSRKDSLCCRCVKFAHDINKNIVCVGYHKGGIFNRQSWVEDEWSLRTDIYAWLDMNSRAAFMAHLRGACGLETLEGDLVGARVTFVNHTDPSKCPSTNLMIYRKDGRNEWTKICDRIQTSSDFTIRLRRGDYYYVTRSSVYPNRVSVEKPFTIKNDSEHKQFEDDLTQLTDQFISYAGRCAETKRKYERLISKTSEELMSTILHFDNKKWLILGHVRSFAWSNVSVLCAGLVIGAIFALLFVTSLLGVDNYKDGFSVLLSMLAFPLSLFCHLSIFSVSFFLSCAVLCGLISLMLKGIVPDKRRRLKVVGGVVALKLLDMFLYDSLGVYFPRRILLGAFTGLMLTYVCFWAAQVLRNIYWKHTTKFRVDYWTYRQEPYMVDYKYVSKKESLLASLGDMSPDHLNFSGDDSTMEQEVVRPMDRYQRQSHLRANITDFPVTSLVSMLLSLAVLSFGLILLVYFVFYLYGYLAENLSEAWYSSGR